MIDPQTRRREWSATFSCLCALFVGVGLGRFGYPPLIPVVISEGLVTANGANVAAATNFLGYLIGALVAARLTERFGVRNVLLIALGATVVSFLACAAPAPGAIALSFWRFISGVTGGVLMIVAPRSVMAAVAPERRGTASGFMFAGVGSGMVISGAALPAIGALGSAYAFLFLAALTAIASLASAIFMPPVQVIAPRAAGAGAPRWRGPLLGLAIAYCGFGAGFVGHTIFMVDYIARGLGRGYGAGSLAWIFMGAGAMLGVVVWGRLADRIGAPVILRTAQIAMAGFVLAGAMTTSSGWLYVSAIGTGACGIALGSLTAMRTAELVNIADYARAWAVMTVLFSLFQAASGYVCAWIFAQSGSYPLIFIICAAVLAATILVEMMLAGQAAAPPTAR